jgi:hypothetical protein
MRAAAASGCEQNAARMLASLSFPRGASRCLRRLCCSNSIT